MKRITLALVILIAEISGYLIKVPTTTRPVYQTPVKWVHLQKLMMPLFENVCEDSNNPMVIKLSQDFTLDAANGGFNDPEVLARLRNLRSGNKQLAKGEIFTEYADTHIAEWRAVYDLLYSAKDFDVFLKAASWARQNVNCGIFVDAICLAMMNRQDTAMLSIPAPYELLPNYFISKDVIIKASSLLTGEEFVVIDGVRNAGNAYIIDANYTDSVDGIREDPKLAYFHEDIGLNSFYFLNKLKKAPWFNVPTDIDSNYGEWLYHMMKQLTIRYDLERYSNELPELETFSWSSWDASSYDPMLVYSNGQDFKQEKMFVNFPDEDMPILQNIENNIVTAVTHMKQSGLNKKQILNHLMEILITGKKSYESLARQFLSMDVDINTNNVPSVLEHYMTSLRDPKFWRLNKNIVSLVGNALKMLPSYAKNELYFPGVEVINVDIKKMSTFFDDFELDVTDALKSSMSDTIFQVRIAQPRLNHLPFTLKLNISSYVAQKGLVKIYLGPKTLPGELAAKKDSFMLIDSFETNLKSGKNIVSRSSTYMKHLSEDFMSLRTLRKKVEDAEFGMDTLPLKTIESQSGFPTRLILPKGTSGGLSFQLFVIVAPYVKTGISGSVVYKEPNNAILSPGYPFDLDIDDRILFELPNVYTKDVIITHKVKSKPTNGGGGGPRKNWQDGNSFNRPEIPEYDIPENTVGQLNSPYVRPSRPDYSSKRKEPYDYQSNRGQYGKKEDYASKRKNFTKDDEKEPITDGKLVDESLTNINEDTILENSETIPSPSPYISLLRPDYTYKRKESFDYKSKRGQYGKKEDYVTRRKNVFNVNDDENQYPKGSLNVSYDKRVDKSLDNINKDKDVPLEISENDMIPLYHPQPDYSSKRKDYFDYKSKKAQYGKKEDYAARRKNVTKDKEDKNQYAKDPVLITDDKLADKILNNIIKDEDNILVDFNGPTYEVVEPIIERDDTNGDLIPVIVREPIIVPSFPKTLAQTIFDYFARSDNDDTTDDEVYE